MSELRESTEQVAIVGMAGRFPGAPDVDTFWANLRDGVEGIAAFTDEELAAAGVDDATRDAEHYVKAKGTLDGADQFDAAFFGYNPREAQLLDPQHRVFLECCWEALETAGCVPGRFDGRIGVFGGTGLNSYLLHNLMANRAVVDSAGRYQTMLASDKDFLATRVSYKLGLTGPSLTVQTACSTSLTAVHLACQSLLNGECDVAIAGGVAVSSPLRHGYTFESGGILSADGHCRPFDADAGGTVPGNGAGVVVLRRLEDAQADGDTVVAVILGTAINNDGSLKAGYTAPSVDGQAAVISEALAVAGVTAGSIGYVETHGTGTVLGDPIELTALTRAFRQDTDGVGSCAIGSVKSNVGHLDAAAGVTALIKTVLMLDREAMPPTLHYQRPNPELRLSTSPFYVNDELRPWPRGPEPRRAGVSSFGIGGTNVHLILQEAPASAPAAPQRPLLMLPLSAKTPAALAGNAQRLAAHLESHPDLPLGDVAHTLTHRRTDFGQRKAVVCQDREEAVAALRRIGPADAVTAAERDARVAFLFPGQGAQYVSMTRDLYVHEPVFTAVVDRCAALFLPHLGVDLRDLLFAPPTDKAAAAALEQTRTTQPALFLVEYALAHLWASWGVRPAAMAGHSIGEYVAACLAGVFTLPDAVRVVAARGRLVQSMPPGAMLSVLLPEDDVVRLLERRRGDGPELAAVNAPGLSVVSGPTGAIDALEAHLKATGVGCRRLHTSHAFHSASMDDAVGPFVEELRAVMLHAPAIPFISGVTGTWITDEQATSPEYWGGHLRRPVRFADAAGRLLEDASLVFVEVGPGTTLSGLLRQHGAWAQDSPTVVASLRHPREMADDRVVITRAAAALWESGVPIDRPAIAPGPGRVVPLPAYTFQRQRFWVEPQPAPAAPVAPAGTEWCHTPGWKRLPDVTGDAADPAGQAWLVLGESGLATALAQRLRDGGATTVRVSPGADQDTLAALITDAVHRLHVVHLRSLDLPDRDPSGWLDGRRVREARTLGFDSLRAVAATLAVARIGVPVTVDVLCHGVHTVTGDESPQPEHATLTGMATVLAQELPDAVCRLLDVSGTDPQAPGDAQVRAVHTILTRETEERTLALRGRRWWRREFDRAPVVALPDGATRLRDGGVYLITGGLGGIGLALAEHIAANRTGPVLALSGRSAFPAEPDWPGWLDTHPAQDPTSTRIRRLQRIAGLGARVVVLQGDVTDEPATARHVQHLREQFGALHGVIHAAGLPASGMIATRPAGDTDAVFAAKVDGTLVLDRVCPAEQLDFLLLCSSATAVLGGPGQSDYAAANAFLDAYAQARTEQGAPVTAVAWGTWEGIGMAAGGALPDTGRQGTPTRHPLLRQVEAAQDRWTYVTTFSTAEHWIVDDHRLMGHGLVPGTAYLDLVYAALREQASDEVVELHDVMFMSPVIVPDGQTRTVYTTVERHDGRLRFTVRSRTADGTGWQEHAAGGATFTGRGPDTVRDLAEVLARCEVTEVVDTEDELRRRFRTDRFAKGAGPLEFGFGPRWQLLRKVQTGGRRMLATLRLDEAFRADLDGYDLHPAILDMAGGVFRMHAEDLYYLPLTYRTLRVVRPLTATVHCAVQIKHAPDATGETLTCDIDLLDDDGRLLVQITDFSVKRINDIPALLEQIERAASEPQPERPAPADGALAALSAGMSEQDGRAAFGRILAAAALPAHLIVAPGDFAARHRLAVSITPASLAQEIAQLPPPATTHPRPDLGTAFVAPANDAERAVVEIWQEILGVEPIGTDDDFFALGGHSLAAVQIGTRIHGRFGVELDLRAFFDAPTVAHTAALLAAQERVVGDVIETVRRDEPGGGLSELDAQLDAHLDALTDDEVDAQLQQLLAEDEGMPR
ncbi:SDR family NAD(P)-dependent oxidoreductase [Dactylosporangium sp. NBC_01737]|uniref:type I polyketide synthase n=1 Tax=Dactylosporangium sp. NBC_01737 TaxID=2975959 RepID=UPI002E0E0F66|nr:SDR family NAD(P)-dependent oxidoreductase [Dactylosporangium sp. NBC_01737]